MYNIQTIKHHAEIITGTLFGSVTSMSIASPVSSAIYTILIGVFTAVGSAIAIYYVKKFLKKRDQKPK